MRASQAIAAFLPLLVLVGLSEGRSLNLADEDPKKYPVTKVITLLRDMQAQLEKEADTDEEVYDKMICWCQTNDREKSLSVQDAQAKIAQLTTLIETSSADSARLAQEITQHEQDLTESTKSLGTATGLRDQQVAEFRGEEKDMLQSVQALGSAIIILSKHHSGGASLLDAGRVRDVLEAVKYQMERHQALLLGTITPRQRRLVLAFGQQPAFRQNYQPQSSEIFGILRQMKETFESNLADSQKEEASNRKAYEELKAAKETEIKATRETIAEKKSRLAETDEKNALAKEEIEDVQNAMTFDDTFLLDLKERCATTRTEYDSRVAMRQEELSAVAEAIKILSDDQARDTFSKVMNPAASLFQRRSARRSAKHGLDERRLRAKAADLLSKVVTQAGGGSLAALVASVQLDPLTRVKAAIDTLVAELIQEKKLEILKRDSCADRANENERITETYQRDKSDLETKIEGYKGEIKDATNGLEALSKEITEMTTEMKHKGEGREAENRDFQSVIKDQREMQALLQKALAVLERVYSAKEGLNVQPVRVNNFVQVRNARSVQPPPAPEGFSTYGASRAKGGVLGMIEQIINDAKTLETESLRDEQSSQEEYENFVKDTNASIKAKQQQMVNQGAVKSNAEQALISSEEDLRAKAAELETLASTASAINMDCDFLVRNFDARMEARDQEVEGLQEAKAVLSGMRLD
mmetsp:Transcript_37724/g.95512  ORF Transcript_37724/g.95512 Transcript_37724/m.95512 type:complete len:700 (-) Transcript_37724:84-2183(-)